MQVVELVDKYDGECVTANDKVGFIQDTKTDKACTRTITVSLCPFVSLFDSCNFLVFH
mgnify:CR=1 FL=1|jgi:hypothetical protein